MGEILKRRIKQKRFESGEHETALNVLVAADFLRRQLDEVCREHDITLTQYNALRILKGAHPSGYPRRELRSRMLEHAPDVTRLIDRLEVSGLVKRVRSETDRRYSVAVITKKGISVVDRVTPGIRRVQSRILGRLPTAELTELSRLCEELYGDHPFD